MDWLRQWAKTEEEREEVFIRGFLGKMIFSGEEALKTSDVLSGGEKGSLYALKNDDDSCECFDVDEPTNRGLRKYYSI